MQETHGKHPLGSDRCCCDDFRFRPDFFSAKASSIRETTFRSVTTCDEEISQDLYSSEGCWRSRGMTMFAGRGKRSSMWEAIAPVALRSSSAQVLRREGQQRQSRYLIPVHCDTRRGHVSGPLFQRGAPPWYHNGCGQRLVIITEKATAFAALRSSPARVLSEESRGIHDTTSQSNTTFNVDTVRTSTQCGQSSGPTTFAGIG